MDALIYPCLARLIIGALGGFAGGFRVAALVLAKKPEPCALHVVAVGGELVEGGA